MTELWKRHPFFTAYDVSDRGRVRRAVAGRGTRAGKVLTGSVERHGYRVVRIKGRSRFVHHLVLETFVGARLEGQECRHLNGARHDNAVANLCWGTRSENHEDRKRHGRTTGRRGVLHLKAKLTDADIVAIRARSSAGETQRAIAAVYHMNHSTIQAIVERRTWRHIA